MPITQQSPRLNDKEEVEGESINKTPPPPPPRCILEADAQSAAVLAPAPLPLVLADARPAAVLASAPLPLVLAEPPFFPSSLRCTLRVRRPAFVAGPMLMRTEVELSNVKSLTLSKIDAVCYG